MEEKKVLIAAPVGDGKEYSINEFFNWISEQSYENFDVCLCVNGETQENLKKKASMLEKVEINDKKLIVLQLKFNEYHTTKVRISESREMIRKYAIFEGYDYIFFMDTDTIPTCKDAIQKLMLNDKPMIGGVYFYKKSNQPIVIDEKTGTNITKRKLEEAANNHKIIRVWGFGFGCVLLKQELFIKIPFDYSEHHESWTDDFQYCEAMEKQGIDRYVDPWVLCRHYSKDDFTIGS